MRWALRIWPTDSMPKQAPDPKPGAYRPFVSARAPFPPTEKPVWRVLVHRQLLQEWNELVDRAGPANARELWSYLTSSPNRPPALGCVSKMRGVPKGSDAVWHYELTGAGRVDFTVHPEFKTADGGDAHPCVKIVGIDYGSH